MREITGWPQFIRRPEITKAAQFAKPDRLEIIQPSQRLEDPRPAGATDKPEVTTGRFQPPTTLNYGFR